MECIQIDILQWYSCSNTYTMDRFMELTLDEALQKAVEAHKAGQVQEADRLYTAILKVQSKHPDANHNMGVLAVGVGRVQEALPFFKTALEANPSIGQYWLSHIDALIKLDRIPDAKAVFDQAKEKGASGEAFDQREVSLNLNNETDASPEAAQLIKKAILHRETGEFATAIKLLTNHLANFSGSVELLSLLAHCYMLNDDSENASIYLDKANEVDPDNASVSWNNVRLLLRGNNIPDALFVARKSIERYPNDIEGIGVLGACLRAGNEFDESLLYLNKAISLKPDYAEALINRGLIKLTQKDKPGALSDLETAHKLKPHMKQIWDLVISLNLEFKQFEQAISFLGPMVKSDPGNENYFVNLALCYQHLDNLDTAIENYQRALKIKPNYAEAYNNMGAALQNKGDSDAAIDSFKQAIKIKPDYAAAYLNMGVSLQDKGDLEAAVDSYKQALKIKPDYAEVWNNLALPLQSMKLQGPTIEELLSTFNPQADSKYVQTEKSVLSYRLHLGGENAERSLNEVCSLLSASDNAIIKNTDVTKNSSLQRIIGSDKIVSLVHFGRSGSGLLHSLIDGHPEVSTLPSIYFSEFFSPSTWENIIAGGWSEIVDRFITTYEVLFDATAQNPIETKSKQTNAYMGQKEGMANVGEQRDEVLVVDKVLFRDELRRLISVCGHLDTFTFFQLVHMAYDKAQNDHNHKHLVFYHIHNPDTHAKLNFVQAAPNANWVMMVREPLQACEAWIRHDFQNNEYTFILAKIITMLFGIDNIIYYKQRSVGVRLEDLKEFPRKTIPALCDWMGIEETESLYEMTAQGKKWWGDPDSPDYLID